MSFVERAADHAKRPTLCKLGTLAAELPTEEAEALAAMLNSPAWSNQALTRAVREEGLSVGRTTLELHRAQACLCFPKS